MFTICFVLWIGVSNLFAETLLDGELSGNFTISSSGEYVHFSQGNLYYLRSSFTWKFAATQYTHQGASNIITAGGLSNKIDLFGYSAQPKEGQPQYGVNTSTSDDAYEGVFVDWGVNKIHGGSQSNVWSTLSKSEWNYILTQRTNATSLYKVCKVDTVWGLMLLPDGSTATINNTYTTTQFSTFVTSSQAVFLPFAARREGTIVDKVNAEGFYWTSIPDGEKDAYMLHLTKDAAPIVTSSARHFGYAVRLVKRYEECKYTVKAEAADPTMGSCSIEIIE